MNSYLTLLLLLIINIPLKAKTVKIAAAADLRFAMSEIVKAYQSKKTDANIDVVYGSSGNAYTQISNGAPFDIFFRPTLCMLKN